MSQLTDVSCSLCRSYKQSLTVLDRAKRRQVSWEQPKQNSRQFDFEDLAPSLTLDEAFKKLMTTLSTGSGHCKSYFRECEQQDIHDKRHCNRYHTSAYRTATRTPHLGQASKSVEVDLQPGNYLVTAGCQESDTQESHVLHIQPGQTVNMKFVV